MDATFFRTGFIGGFSHLVSSQCLVVLVHTCIKNAQVAARNGPFFKAITYFHEPCQGLFKSSRGFFRAFHFLIKNGKVIETG